MHEKQDFLFVVGKKTEDVGNLPFEFCTVETLFIDSWFGSRFHVWAVGEKRGLSGKVAHPLGKLPARFGDPPRLKACAAFRVVTLQRRHEPLIDELSGERMQRRQLLCTPPPLLPDRGAQWVAALDDVDERSEYRTLVPKHEFLSNPGVALRAEGEIVPCAA